jgi:hypothetical protein
MMDLIPQAHVVTIKLDDAQCSLTICPIAGWQIDFGPIVKAPSADE